MASDADHRIRVGIRIRNLTKKERDKNKSLQWKYSDNQMWQIDPATGKRTGNAYSFDYVFGMVCKTLSVFDDLVKPIVESSVQGFNGTIFAYGQTSSGKTYTMMGEKSEEGIISLSVNHMFTSMERFTQREYLIRVSYMEIYNEQIHDLLEYQSNLKIHEDSTGQAYVPLKEEVADCPEKVLAAMKRGEKQRRFGVTDINERSSRSHTIFKIVIESRKKQPFETANDMTWDDAVQISHLNLVDLAGSERAMHTKATGHRFKEGCAINKSLFYLGNVISQLSEGSGQYVNFRDSKLTRILRSSLGGNAHTAVICTVTPASVEETISTLNFASRASCVTNEPHVNEVVSDECLIRRHEALVKKLEKELKKAKQDNECITIKKELEQKEEVICRLKDWIRRDMVQVCSPRIVSRSERRKTWSASDLEDSLRRSKLHPYEKLLPVPGEHSGDCYPSVEALDNDEENQPRPSSDFQENSDCWNNENHVFQSPPLSWHTPSVRSFDKDSGREIGAMHSKKKKRKCSQECCDYFDLPIEEREQCRKVLENSLVVNGCAAGDLHSLSLLELCTQLSSNIKGTQFLKDPVKVNTSNIDQFMTPESPKDDISSQLREKDEQISVLEAMVADLQVKMKGIEEGNIDGGDDMGEESVSRRCSDLCQSESFMSGLESGKEERSCLGIPLEDLELAMSREKERLSKIEYVDIENSAHLKCLLDEVNAVLFKKEAANMGQCELERFVEIFTEYIADLESQLQQREFDMSSLLLIHKELSPSLLLEKQYSQELKSKLEGTLDVIVSCTKDLMKIAARPDKNVHLPHGEEMFSQEGVYDDYISVMQNLATSIGAVREKIELSNCKKDERMDELGNQVVKLSSAVSEREEEIALLKSELGKCLADVCSLKCERDNFECLLYAEKETRLSVDGKLESSEDRVKCLSDEMLALSERLRETDLKKVEELRECLSANGKARLDQIQMLQDEVETSEVVIANLAESDEENLSLLKEMAEKMGRVERELSDSLTKVMLLMEENSTVRKEAETEAESFEAIKCDMLKYSAECESYRSQLQEEREGIKKLEEVMNRVLEQVSLLTEDRDKLFAENKNLLQINATEREKLIETCNALEEAKCEQLNLHKEKENLISFLKTNKDDCISLQNQLEKSFLEIESLSKQLKEMEQACGQRDSSIISSLKEELENVKSSFLICEQSEMELDNLLSLERERVISLKSSLEAATVREENLSIKCEKLMESFNLVEEKLKLSIEEKEKMKCDESKCWAVNKDLKNEIGQLHAVINQGKQAFDSMESDYKLQIEKYESKLGELNTELSCLKTKLQEEFNTNKCLNKQLQLEKDGHAAASAAQEKILGLINFQEDAISVMRASREERISELSSSIENLKMKLSLKKENIHILKSKCDEFELKLFEQSSDFSTKLSVLNQENKELEGKLSVCKESEIHLKAANEELKIAHEVAISEMRASREERISELSSSIENLKMKLSLKKENIHILKSKCDEFELKLFEQSSDFSTKLSVLNQENKELEGKLSVCKESEIHLKAANEELKIAHEVAISEMRASREERISELSSSIENLKMKLSLKKENIHILKSKCDEFELKLFEQSSDFSTKLSVLNQENKELEGKLSVCKESEIHLKAANEELKIAHEVAISEMRASGEERISELSSSIENLKMELNLKKENFQILKSKCDELELKLFEQSSDFSTELSVLNQENKELEGKLSVCKESEIHLIAANEELKIAHEVAISEMRASGEERISELSSSIENLKMELNLKKENFQILKSKCDELELKLFEQSSDFSTELSVLNQENKELEGKLSVCKESEIHLIAANEELKIAHEVAISEMRASGEERISELSSSIENLKMELNLKKENFQILKSKCDELELKLFEQSSDFSTELSVLNQENKELERKLSVCKESEIHLIAANEELKIAHEVAISEMQASREERISELSSSIENLKMELNLKKENFQILKSKCDELELKLFEQSSDFSTKLSVLNQENRELEGKLSVCKESEIHLKAANEEINRGIMERDAKLAEVEGQLKKSEENAIRMEKWALRLEKRGDIILDHRIAIQQEAAKEKEQFEEKIKQLQDQLQKPDLVKCKCQELRKDLDKERNLNEDLGVKLRTALLELESSRSKVEEYKREVLMCKQLLVGGVSKQEPSAIKPKLIESGVQTTPVTFTEVLEIDPAGCGIVQICKIDVLEKRIKKLEEDKELLKNICRRRHAQREELKLQLEELNIKFEALQGTQKRD